MRALASAADEPFEPVVPGAHVDRCDDDKPYWPAWQRPAAAILLAIVALATVLVAHDVDRQWLLGLFLLLALVPWLFEAFAAREAPALLWLLMLAAMVVLHPVGQAIGVTDRPHGSSQASLLLLVFGVAQLAATARFGVLVFATVAGTAIIIVAGNAGPDYDSATLWCAAMYVALFSGLLIRRLLSTVKALEDAQAALAADAAARERQRIAREVHDVIAHSMTVTMLHVTAARMAIGRGDDAAATEALKQAERAGRSSLADIRSTVGLLRAEGMAPLATAVPEPGGADLDVLLEGYRVAGLRVVADVDAAAASLPPAVGLTVYRVVQEALANVARHADGAGASVRVAVDGDGVEVDVVDDGPGAAAGGAPGANGSGHGLLGMRERVESLGGRVDAGVAPSGSGWRVRAVLPA